MKRLISMLLVLLCIMGTACAEEGLQQTDDGFTGNYGYTISCGDNVHAYNSEGCDNFVLDKEDGTTAAAIAISLIPAMAMEETKEYALDGHGVPCTLGVEHISALRVRHEADTATAMIRETTLCPLDDGSGLLIDVMWAADENEPMNAALASDMLASFRLTANAPKGEVAYLYGLLKAIDTKDMLLSYQEVEVIYDTDIPRIDQLKAQGVELDMINGCAVYALADFIIAQPYSQYVEFLRLNSAHASEISDIVMLSKRLEDHPEYLLCKLGILNGTIVTIEEVNLP